MDKQKLHKLAIKYILDELTDEEYKFIVKELKDEDLAFFLAEIEKHSPKRS